jgi:hypothetical protein
LGMPMAQKFSLSKDPLCMINIESRPPSRITFGWLEGHGLGSSKVGNRCLVSQGNLDEMNGDMNFASSN